MTAWAVAWDSFLVLWYLVALSRRDWSSAAFALGHLAVGIVISYLVVARWVNRTTIRVGAHGVTVSHGPVPWFGNRTLPATEIQGVFCQTSVSWGSGQGNPGFSVHLSLASGETISLISSIPFPEQALFLARTIEQYLQSSRGE